MTVAELEDRMSLRELRRWQEFSRLEPFPSERVDLSGALVASVLANLNRGKNTPPLSIQDFMIVDNAIKGFDRQQEVPDDREAQHLLNTILALGGSVHG